MDLRRFLDLYVSEAQEHVRLLQRSLLAVEDQPQGGAVHEAFRAAHTLKGISAAMGYTAVADRAHHLEDRLDDVRAGRITASPDFIDTLLTEADALESAIAAAVAGVLPEDAAVEQLSAAAPAPARTSAAMPPNTAMVALVRLRPDAPIKSARAMLVVRAVAGPGMLGTDPSSFDDDFDGEFRIFFDAAADLSAAEAAIAAAGEVESVELVEPARARASAPQPVAQPAAPARQVRVDPTRLDMIAEGIGELSVLYARLDMEQETNRSCAACSTARVACCARCSTKRSRCAWCPYAKSSIVSLAWYAMQRVHSARKSSW